MRTGSIIAFLFTSCGVALQAYEGPRANSVPLNGPWEFSLGDGDEGAETPAGQEKLDWRPVTLPGPFMEWNEKAATSIKYVWARRSFQVSPSQARSLAVLRWNHITLGASAAINGQEVGKNEPTGPYQVLLTPGILRAGRNQIVLKIAGAAGVRKARSGYFLIPAGFASCHRRGMPAVTDDIWIDFSHGVYLKWILAMPDLARSKVRIRVTPTGLEPLEGLRLVATVRPWPEGPPFGKGQAAAVLDPNMDPAGGKHFVVEVPMPGFKPWTHEDRNLYRADVQALKGEEILDRVIFRFGMREITVADGNYKLNGRNLWLRGSNLVFEWNWEGIFEGKEIDYLVTEAREMSMNSFRTHTQPLPRLWADVCDEHGTMILAEFPCLYNYRDYGFTPREYEIWRRNVITDAAGWMARLWNHPAVIMWVLSNESRIDREWEMGSYRDFVRRLDPTRPTLRTGDTGTAENFDVHTCGNTVGTYEGRLLTQISGWFTQARGRTVTNTEYMNIFQRPLCQWTGMEDRDADALAYAQLGMEHTEAMRRARLDGMWPYMYAGWTRTRRGGKEWKAGFAQPVSACWHSALSSVLASLDLFDANYTTGQEITTDLYLVNDSWHDARIHVDLLLTRDCPEFIPEARCFEEPIDRWGFDFSLEADSLTKVPVRWRLPGDEGSYWLTARTTGLPGRPVLSQRFVRAVRPPAVPDSARRRTYVVLGGDRRAAAYFDARGLRTSPSLEGLRPDKHVVVVWNAARVAPEHRRGAAQLLDFAAAGGCIVVLSTRSWDWDDLCPVDVGSEGGSRVFPYDGERHHTLLTGISPEWLKRWNGLPGTVAVASLEGSANSRWKKILWVREPGNTVVAEVPAGRGSGVILFSQLAIQDRVDPSKPSYDPVAERILLNLLTCAR